MTTATADVTIEEIPPFEDGQILGLTTYRPLFRNDQFLDAFADRERPVWHGVSRGWIGTETEQVVYDGWIYLDSLHTELVYYIGVQDGYPAHPTTVSLYFDYGGAGQVLIDSVTPNNSAADTYDLSAFADGLYRVYCEMTRIEDDNGYGARADCRAPYLEYTGPLSYTSPPAVTDGSVPPASDFNAWRDNDAWFQAQLSPNPGFLGLTRGFQGGGSSCEIWRGWLLFEADTTRVYYRASQDSVAEDNELLLYFDYEGGDEALLVTIDDTDDHEGYADVPAGVYTPGTHYQVAWVMTRVPA